MDSSLYTAKIVNLTAARHAHAINIEVDDDDNRRGIRRASSERLFA